MNFNYSATSFFNLNFLESCNVSKIWRFPIYVKIIYKMFGIQRQINLVYLKLNKKMFKKLKM